MEVEELTNQKKTFGFVGEKYRPFKLCNTIYITKFFMYGTYDLHCIMSQQDKLLEK